MFWQFFYFIPIRILTLHGSECRHVFLFDVFRGSDEHIEWCFDLTWLCGDFNCNNHNALSDNRGFLTTACIAYNAKQNIRIYSLSGCHAALCLFLLYAVYFVAWIYRLSLISIRGLFKITASLFIKFIFSNDYAACLKVRQIHWAVLSYKLVN